MSPTSTKKNLGGVPMFQSEPSTPIDFQMAAQLPQVNHGTKLFLGSLPPDCTVEEIKIFFLRFGITLEEVYVMGGSAASQRRSRSGNSCAFIKLAHPDVAQAIVLVFNKKVKLFQI